jgi:hypothetical protein
MGGLPALDEHWQSYRNSGFAATEQFVWHFVLARETGKDNNTGE